MTSSLIFTIYSKCVCETAEVSFLGLFFWAPEEIPLCEILELEYDNKAGGRLPAVMWFPLAHRTTFIVENFISWVTIGCSEILSVCKKKKHSSKVSWTKVRYLQAMPRIGASRAKSNKAQLDLFWLPASQDS